jgi:3-oxoacyl-[acyl-carrier protein] reductase
VTGAAKRIGREIALTLARAGATVAITFRESEEDAEKTLREIVALDRDAISIRCDVSDETGVREAVKEVVAEFGGLDILVNNAGAYETVRFEEITLAQWDAMFASNVRGPFLVSREAACELRKRRGRIINIGSLGGIHPWATHAHYCASKAALHMLTKATAKALAPEVSVNCVAPGLISIGKVEQGYEHFVEKTPMKRNGSPADVAEAVLYFSTATHFITGQILVVDGGLGL